MRLEEHKQRCVQNGELLRSVCAERELNSSHLNLTITCERRLNLRQVEIDEVLAGRGTVSNFYTLCEFLDLDGDLLFSKGVLRKRRTPTELLEELEPCGKGTDEQRAMRLVFHDVISRGRAAEILRVSRADLPKEVDTGCSCIACREE